MEYLTKEVQDTFVPVGTHHEGHRRPLALLHEIKGRLGEEGLLAPAVHRRGKLQIHESSGILSEKSCMWALSSNITLEHNFGIERGFV